MTTKKQTHVCNMWRQSPPPQKLYTMKPVPGRKAAFLSSPPPPLSQKMPKTSSFDSKGRKGAPSKSSADLWQQRQPQLNRHIKLIITPHPQPSAAIQHNPPTPNPPPTTINF